MRKTKETLHLECILTDQEKLDYSKILSEKVSEQQRLGDSLKSVQTQMKAEMTACEETIRSLADKINTSREYRPVECEIKYDFKENLKTWIRKDTEEIVTAKERSIPEDERQEEVGIA